MNNKRVKVYRASQHHLVKQGMTIRIYVDRFCKPYHIKSNGRGHTFVKQKFLIEMETVLVQNKNLKMNYRWYDWEGDVNDEESGSSGSCEFFEIVEDTK